MNNSTQVLLSWATSPLLLLMHGGSIDSGSATEVPIICSLSLITTLPQQSTSDARDGAAVEEMLSTGRLPSSLSPAASVEELTVLVHSLDRHLFLERQSGKRFGHGNDALRTLLERTGPLPDGMPSGLRSALWVASQADSSAERGLVADGLCALAILADGPSRLSRRLGELPSSAADHYAAAVAEAMSGRIVRENAVFAGPVKAWTEQEVVAAAASLSAWVDERCEDTTVASALPDNAEKREAKVAGILFATALMGDQLPVARAAMAEASIRMFNAMDATRERLGRPRVGAGIGLTSTPALLALTGVGASSTKFEQVGQLVRAIDAYWQQPNDRVDAKIIAAWVPVLDRMTLELCPMFSAMQANGTGSMLRGFEDLPELFRACAALIDRLAALPPDHLAWTASNRCEWIAAVDRRAAGGTPVQCVALAKAWNDASSQVPAQWRDECRARCAEQATGLDGRRASRKARRDAWEADMKIRAFPPEVLREMKSDVRKDEPQDDSHAPRPAP